LAWRLTVSKVKKEPVSNGYENNRRTIVFQLFLEIHL
jgi:hypothetical protein